VWVSEIKALLLSQKTVLTFNEVVVYTGLSKSHLYKLTSTNQIPCYCPKGKLLYFSKTEIDKYLLSNRKKSSEELDSEASTYVALEKQNQKS
jgi:excisionase family DNA binding protein